MNTCIFDIRRITNNINFYRINIITHKEIKDFIFKVLPSLKEMKQVVNSSYYCRPYHRLQTDLSTISNLVDITISNHDYISTSYKINSKDL